MITNKQRAYLRSLGNSMDPIFQVGKNGIDENFIIQVDQALKVRELIKIKVLNNNEITAREASDLICSKLKCDGVQAIGSKFLIYRKAKEAKIQLP